MLEKYVWREKESEQEGLEIPHRLLTEQSISRKVIEERESGGVWQPEPVVVELKGLMRHIEVPVWRERKMADLTLGVKTDIRVPNGHIFNRRFSFETMVEGRQRKKRELTRVNNTAMFMTEKETNEFDEELAVLESGIAVPRHVFLTVSLANRVADWLMGWGGVFNALVMKKQRNMSTPRFTQPPFLASLKMATPFLASLKMATPFLASLKMHYGLVCLVALNSFIDQINYQIKEGQNVVAESDMSVSPLWTQFLENRRQSREKNDVEVIRKIKAGPKMFWADEVRPETLKEFEREERFDKQLFFRAQPLFLQL